MKSMVFLAALSVALATVCFAAASTAKPVPAKAPPPSSQAEHLTKRLRDDEAKLRTERDATERDRLTNDIETTKHQLGPRDASGARLQFAAMWHDAAIEWLDTDYKRLAGRAKLGGASAPATALALETRASLRRVASTCLLRGWTWGGTLPKYQFDAYGSYLTNNLPTLDALFETLSTALAKEATLPPAAPDREAFLAALAQAKEGCAKMNQAAETFAAADAGKTSRDRAACVAALGTFHQGLETVCEADAVLREFAGKQPKGDASAPAAAPQVHPSADEKAAIEKIRAVTATIAKDATWQKTADALDRFSAAAEGGLATERTRSGAQELLLRLLRVAEYVEALGKSKSAYPEYIAVKQEALADAFSYLTQKGYRQYAYSRLRRISDGDRDRLALDASPLSPAAAQGLLQGLGLHSSAFSAAEKPFNFETFDIARSRVMTTITKMADWPPKGLSPQLAPIYKKFLDVFLKTAEAASTARPDVPLTLMETYQAAALFGRDLERVVAADRAIRAVEQYAPQRAASMYDDFLKRADGLAGSLSEAAKTERTLLDEYYQPFQSLADLDFPGPTHQQVAQTLTGGTYRNALAVFGRQITGVLPDAARGRVSTLSTTLEARWMFRALRHRCVAETDGLAKMGAANLDPFSMPEKTYATFVGGLDQNLRRLMARYANEHAMGNNPQCLFLSQWDTVYCYIGAAQRQTQKTRHAGQSDLDFLMANLAQAADPTPPDSAWFGWAVGYHTTEAATCLIAGYDRTAGHHLSLITEHRLENHLDKELLPTAFDPK